MERYYFVNKIIPQRLGKMTKILVTGGAGFIGSHLVENLVCDGYDVVVLDNLLRGNKIPRKILDSIYFIKGDVKNKEAVVTASKGCKYIFHLAAVLGVDIVADHPLETMETETVGMQNVAEATLKNGIEKIIYASTSGVYGHSAIEQSVKENIQLDPRTSYAIAKRYNEIYLAALNKEKGVQSISLRYFNVYGTRQDCRMVIPRFFQQALRNEPITIFGTGQQTRDFTYTNDTIKATVELAKKVNGCEIFNIAQGNETTINELAKQIKDIVGSNSEIVNVKASNKRYDYEVERRVGCSNKLFNAINFRPLTPLRKGLKKICSYYFEINSKKGRFNI